MYLAELVVDALGLGYWYRRGAAAPRGTAAAGECCRLSGCVALHVNPDSHQLMLGGGLSLD